LTEFLANGIVFVAALITGLTGFGFALLGTPFLFLLYPIKTAVVLAILLNSISVTILLVPLHKDAQWTPVGVLAAASLPGLAIGAYLLVIIRENLLLLLIGGITIIFAVVMLLGVSRPFKHENWAAAVSGFVSGILGASTGLNGPPVVLFASNQGWPKEPFRANMTTYRALLTIPTLLVLVPTGLLSIDLIWECVKLLPGLLLGLVVGFRVFQRFSPLSFQRFVLVLLIAVSILTVWGALQG
jgi:uncharacterized membrane protein YfcA